MTDRQTDRQTDGQTDWQTDRQTAGIAVASTALAMRALQRAVKKTYQCICDACNSSCCGKRTRVSYEEDPVMMFQIVNSPRQVDDGQHPLVWTQ